jgi:ABC-type glycerol-3-phosphate transport system permease component
VPPPVLPVLIVLVGAYVVLAGVAFLGFIMARRQPPPPAPSEWPPVSVVVPTAASPDGDLIEQIQASDYPTDRLELLVPASGPAEPSSRGRDEGATVRHVSVPEAFTRLSSPSDPLEQAIEAAEGEIVLSMPSEGTVPSGWIRSMVRRCTPDTPVVVGPTIVEHEDLFLPRLQALSHLGRFALTTGLSYVGIPAPVDASNRAARADALPDPEAKAPATGRALVERPPAFNPEAEAVVGRAPVSSFRAFLQRLAQGLRRAFHSSSWLVWGQAVGLWLLHSVLLACAIVAIAVPGWRQPTLLALVALMGANVVLTLPAATPYGQRGLLRSIVATVLMLVLALPIAGLWALVGHFREPEPEPLRGDA